MKKVIIFGASEAGKNYIKKQKEFSIVAVADNDKEKSGKFIENIAIITPKEIVNYEVDFIVITSMYFNPIKAQLIGMGVEENKIIAAPKRLLKPVENPFEHEPTLNFAINTIHDFTNNLERLGIECFLDFGTLLGVIRDNNLISWDDDIDLTVLVNDVEKLCGKIDGFIDKLDDSVIWKYQYIYNSEKKITSIVFKFVDIYEIGLKPFTIDIWIVSLVDGYAIQTMNKCNEVHFKTTEVIEFKGQKVNVPHKYELYLEHTYGEWKIPNKESTFADYPFAFTK